MNKKSLFSVLAVLAFAGLAPQAQAQVGDTLTGPAGAANCGVSYFTNRIVNNGTTVTGLFVTNDLPSASYAYVPGLSTVTLPSGTVLTGAAANPTVNNNSTNLVWDFSAVTSGSALAYPVISEVYFNASQTPEDQNEWVEIYNPTPAPINLTGWSLRDAAPGVADTLPAFTLNPGEYVVIAGRTNAFRTANPGYTNRVFEVADGKIGSGLNNFGDGVFLRNAATVTVDAVSYGASTAAFNPSVPVVSAGRSIARNPANNDTNTRNDWVAQTTPNPGTGSVPTGIQNGGVITIVYAVEINCDAGSGQLFSRAGFSQGGAPGTALGAAFLTVSPADLIVTKTPTLQNAGVGDFVTWTVRVENAGFGAAANVQVLDRLGAGLAFRGFSIPPTTQTSSNATWTAAAIPQLASLAAQDFVQIAVTAEVVSCRGLFNRADATWRCSGLTVLTNRTCEDTSLINETALAGILFIDRYPSVTVSAAPDPLTIAYCSGGALTFTVSNAAGATVGPAQNMFLTPTLPAGLRVTGAAVTGGLIRVGNLLPGASTSVTVNVELSGPCPITPPAGTFNMVFRPDYTDACGNPFSGPLEFVGATVGSAPFASITKIMPASVNADGGPFPVRIELTYGNFTGTERIRVTDLFPIHPNLYATNASAGGTLNSTSVTWNVTPGAGSGVVTTSFQMAFRTNCAGPRGLLFNQVLATSFTNCLGCVIPVSGSGDRFPIRVTDGGCGTTNPCNYASVKTVSPALTEVCAPVMVTHTFSSFVGTTGNWTGVTFASDLAGGTLDTSNQVVVLVNGSNVTSFVSFTQTAPNLTLNLAGLNGSIFSNKSTVTTLAIAWPVSRSTVGQAVDTSTLTIPGCETETDAVYWYVGGSAMTISMLPELSIEACGISPGRIDLAMLPSPQGGVTNAYYPAYDVEVVLDLDQDGDAFAGYAYLAGSTVFSNLVNLAGTPIASFEPTISGNRLTWNLGDLRTNAGMSISYKLLPGCVSDANGKIQSRLRYNTRCGDGTVSPPAQSADSAILDEPFFTQAYLLNSLQPEVQFLQDRTIRNTIRVRNSGVGDAFHLRVEMDLPAGVAFAGAEIPPTTVTTTNVVWTFTNLTAVFGPLHDDDGDGFFDDLDTDEELVFTVTNTLVTCTGAAELKTRASYGCFGLTGQTSNERQASFETLSGSLVTRATFPALGQLCGNNPVEYRVRNSGLTVDYDVRAFQTVPTGMAYVPGSSRLSINGGPTNAIADPSGTGAPGNPLTWTSNNVPLLAAMQPNDQASIFYQVTLGCSSLAGDFRFLSEGRYTDLCGDVITNRQVISVLNPQQADLEVEINASTDVADLNELVVYTVEVRHSAASQADVPFLILRDVLPAGISFVGASVPPNSIAGQTLIWSNATLNALTGNGVAPFALGEGAISIVITGRVTDCGLSLVNSASVDYGCSAADICRTASDSVSIVTKPILNPNVVGNVLLLTTCGGTKTMIVTNTGASTASDLVYREYAPAGYIFTGASATGEFNSASLIVTYSGTPVGSIGTVDFNTSASSGATDAKDDIGDGLANLELGKKSGFRVVWTLASAGANLDCLADPTDLDYLDPEQGDPSSLASSNRLDYTDLCADPDFAIGTVSAFPGIADLDIDLQPNSQIVTNGQVVSFLVSILNDSETTNADGGLHARVRLGGGWTNVTYVSSNIVSSGTTSMQYEQQGNSNLLMRFPGVILDPIDDKIEVTFTAQATQNGGFLDVYAEVAGDCGNPAIAPTCTFSNTLGQAPFVNTMAGSVLGPVNGQYYSFDQDRFVAAGHSLTKTVRYDEELAAAAGTNRIARVGEALIYRIEALYFGGAYSNVTVTDTLPAQLGFGTPVNYAFSGGITNAVWNPATGVFTLQPAALATNPSSFAVDIPVVVSNRLDVQNGAIITNVATTAFSLPGFTNVPPPRSTTVPVREPNLTLTKTVSANLVQAGDIILFTNRLVHSGLSTTSAYNLVFTDTLPPGLTFNAFVSPATGTVVGNVITFTTNDSADLVQFDVGEPAIEFVFSVLVNNQIVGATVTNRSQVTYISLDEASVNGNQRTGVDGVGGLNDYVANAQVAVSSRPIGNLTKTFISSTQTNTLDGATNDWTIGERFIYQIRVDLPQGVVSNLVLTDVVPAGIDWVGGNTNAGLAYPGRGYEFEIPAGGPQFPTNAGPGLTITDADPTPNSSTTTDGSGVSNVFRFAAITNAADGNAANDYFLLRLEFVALDIGSNVGILPTPRQSNNVVRAQDAFTTRGATGPVYRIVEHDVRALKTRSLATPDAGDVMTFTVVASNQVNALANAYDVIVSDTLSSNVYDLSTFTLVSLPSGWGASNVAVAGGLRFDMFSSNNVALAPNTGATGVFTVALAQGVRPNQIYTNQINITESTTLYGLPPGGIAERNDTANNSVTFTVPGLGIAKTLDSTSETNIPPDSIGANVQIGERLTYRLAITLPEATLTNLTVVDTLSTNGLAYIFGSARLVTTGFVGSTGAFVESPAGAANTLSAMGQTMTFSFTNVVVTGNNVAGDNTFYILADYLALNNAANDGLPPGVTVHTNRATLTYSGNPGSVVTSAVVTTTVVEPSLQITKRVSPTNNVDAGDVISVTLTVTNSGTATAYDVAVDDVLNPLYFDIGTLANVVVPTGFVHQVVGNTFRVLSDTNAPTGTNTIEVGESLVVTFDVRTAGTLPPNVTVTNRATVLGDSLASTNIFGVQRPTGATNSAIFTGVNFTPAKLLVATSETGPADSTGRNLQIGEIATYEISVGLPEGTITNLSITDFMPDGMAYVVGSLQVLTNGLNGTLAPATNVTPNAGPLGASGEDVVITWTGDSVLAATTNASSNILRIRLDAVVLNIPANVGVAPQTVLTNSASVTYAGNPNPPAVVVGPPVTLIEPRLAISKTVSPDFGDAGDVVTVTLVATNSGLATAYDLDVSDVLRGETFNVASITPVSIPAGFLFSVVNAAPDATVRIRSDVAASYQPTNTLEAGESLTFVFTVPLSQAVRPGAIYTNGATLAADTIYTTNVVGIQRSYTNSAQDTLSISNMLIAKALAGTSLIGPADTTTTNLTIGELAFYNLTVTLPEGTITNLTVVDAIPAGMRYMDDSVVVDDSSFGGTVNLLPTVTTAGGEGDDVTITFDGLTVVTGDNNSANNSVVIQLALLVLDVPGNDGLPVGVDGDGTTVLPNSATVAFGGHPPVATSGVVNVSVVEPLLGIEKTMALAANRTVVMDLVVTNRGLSTAFDVEIQDVLTTTWWDTDTIAPVTVPAGFTFAFTGNPGNATITIASDPGSVQPINSIEVGESLLFQFQAQLKDGAPSPVTNRATVTEHSTIDGADPFERDEPPSEDDAVLPFPSFSLTKVRTSPLNRAAFVGETVTFDVVVANTGPIGLNPVPLEDRYDTTYLSYVSSVPASVNNVNDGTINWTNVGPLAVGQSVTVAVQFVAAASTLPGETTNRAVASPFTTNGIPLPPKTNEAPVQIVTVGYTLEKDRISPAARPATIGEPVVFQITVVNTGEVQLVTVPVVDTYETAYLTYVSSVPASVNNVNDGTINWTDIGPLPVGATTTIVATFTAAADTLGAEKTNVVVTTPTTPTNAPPVPPKTNDAPYQVTTIASLGDYVWLDLDRDGLQDAGEPGVSNVVVTLYDAATNALGVTTTDVAGAYAFTNLVPGVYFVGFARPAGYEFTLRDQGGNDALDSDADPATGRTIPTTLSGGENDPTWDAGLFQRAALGNFVWLDQDRDGLQDVGEPGVSNVVVTLYDAATNAVGVTTTAVNGAYAFTNLIPGVYFVGFATPAGYELTLPDQGGDDALDSDANATTGRTIPTTLISGENDLTWDAGLFQRASLGNFVWLDQDRDGLQDAGEPGVSNVVVTLYDAATNAVGVTTTAVNGAYAFTNLIPGVYFVGFATPAGYELTLPDQGGDDALDGDANTTTGRTIPTTLVSGENDLTWDAGLFQRASLGNFVWDDLNRDGLQTAGEPGVSNVVVTLYDAATNAVGVTTTAVNGAYAFTNLIPGVYFVGFATPAGYELTLPDQGGDDALDSDANGTTGLTIPTTLISGENDLTWDAGLFRRASLGDYVWLDVDGNGIQGGAGETGVVGVVVTLYDAANVAIGTTTTSVTGAYAFTNLIPGVYSVGFAPPAGYQITLRDQGGDDALDSDADRTTGRTVQTTLISGENDPTWDAGIYLPASLGDFVWNDLNANGVQDGGETGVVGVVVTLYNAASNVVGTTTTSVTGAYAFTNLIPGVYAVRVSAPAGWYVSPQDAIGDNALDSDINGTTGLTTAITLVSGQNDPTWDAGIYLPASLGDFVWNDLNANGVQDGGETGVVGVVVTLYNAASNAVGTTTTAVNGAYAFTNLVPGTYSVGFAPPAGYRITLPDQGGNDALDSDANPATGRTIQTALVSGENDPTWDAGIYLPASLGDFVWDDLNRDGEQDAGEPGVSNVVVTLFNAASNVVGTTTTAVNGAYAFTNLVPGVYFVGFTRPAGYEFTLRDQGDDATDSDANTTTGRTIPTTLISGENDPTWDTGLFRRASLGNFVWDDLNRNGLQDPGEPGVPGVTVTLYDSANLPVGSPALTGVNGEYAFVNLMPGDYTVRFTGLPAGYEFTLQNQGGDDALDSDADVTTGWAATTTLVSGENDPTWDAGLFRRASLGDYVWLDVDGNGLQGGAGETGIQGVVVTLYDAANAAIGTTTTAVNGAYAFTNLIPGVYSVGFAPPAGYQITLRDQGANDAQDSDADRTTGRTVQTTLISGENDLTWDAGLYLPASLGDFVWNDLNADGVQDGGETGVVGVVVTLYDAATNAVGVTTTAVNGAYAFTNLIPGVYFVGFASPTGYEFTLRDQGADGADSDADPTTGRTIPTALVSGENDPTWDAGLFQRASLGDFVWLDVNGNGLQDLGETGIGGVTVMLYDAASNVVSTTTTDGTGFYSFTNLVPATYSVGFTPPAGYQITLRDQGGNDALDSDADRTTGRTVPTTLISGENDLTWDAGLYVPAALGDLVWEDLDANGVQDSGEPGVAGVLVRLYDANTNEVGTTRTDGNGRYVFGDLIPATYFVGFDRPAGYRFTQQDEGGDDALDSDVDPTTGRAIPTDLVSGEFDGTWDAGIYRPASVGDYVWVDENWDGIQDAGEPGLANVRVELRDGEGNLVAETLTDLDGRYLFSDLPPGDYTVRADLTTVDPQLAANPTFDWDGALDSETAVTLASGDAIRYVDFGYNWEPSDGVLGAIGDRVWVDANADGVQDPGEAAIPNVTVNLYGDPLGTGSYTTLLATATTDASGLYIFTNLPAGAYVVQVDTNTLPAGYVQTGDPDTFGTSLPAGTGDHRTTQPVVLAPGDVFLNVDFGYWPPQSSNLGDLVFFDANADGNFDVADGDYAIDGVTVALLDSTGKVIASTITRGGPAATNNYLFTGLSAGEYTVWINDVGNVLGTLVQTADPDGGLDSRSTTTLDGVNDDLVQDHGYTPDGHDDVLGLIGDTVFLDRNNNGQPDDGEGLEGVTVRLFDGTGMILLATTVTDGNGRYYFGGLEAGEYVVRVDTGTLPNSGNGLANTVDPDTAGLGDSESFYDLGSGEINLDQDFGYVPDVPSAIAGTIWSDCNDDGMLDGDELRKGGVTVVLRRMIGEGTVGGAVATTITDANGDYEFTGLPDGDYAVDVTDEANVLNGHWHSYGPNPGEDDNSQSDPYFVRVSGGETNTTADFGYYLPVAALGDFIWRDFDQDGLQDSIEPGINNVWVTLRIEYPTNGIVVTMQTQTRTSGWYQISNLLLFERYRGTSVDDPAVSGLPRFRVSVDSSQAALLGSGYFPTLVNAGNGTNDSRNHTGTYVMLEKCGRSPTNDFGYFGGPLLAVIGNVEAFTRAGQTIVRWDTIESWGTAGFYLERWVGGQWVRISQQLLPFPLFGTSPIVYEEVDPGAASGGTYLYRLVELENSGNELTYGPYELTVDGPGRTYAAWVTEHFTPDEQADPSISGRDADPDGDRLTNAQEFLAGTDPKSADSVLQITGLRKVSGGLELRWDSVAGRIYRLAVSDSLLGTFLPLEEPIPATATETRQVLPTDFQGRQMYFQVILVGGE